MSMNLMVGTSPNGKGGVSAVAAAIIAAGFLAAHNIRYVASQESDASNLGKGLIFIGAFATVLGQLITQRPGILHAHSSAKGSFVRKSLILGVARLFGWKTIFHLHSGYFKQYATEYSGPLMRWWIRRTLTRSSVVIALSHSWAEFISSYAPGANVKIIPNFVKLIPQTDQTLVEPGRILFLGDLTAAKGIFELLTAITLLKPFFPNIKLILGGNGNFKLLQAKLKALNIAQNVEMLGWIESDNRQLELTRAALFALPSHIEGLPMAMLEAMSAGKAVVVTPVGGIAEVIDDGKNGLLIPVKDAQALASAFKRLLENPSLATTLGVNARATIAQHYSSDAVLSKLSSIYDTLGQTLTEP